MESSGGAGAREYLQGIGRAITALALDRALNFGSRVTADSLEVSGIGLVPAASIKKYSQ